MDPGQRRLAERRLLAALRRLHRRERRIRCGVDGYVICDCLQTGLTRSD